MQEERYIKRDVSWLLFNHRVLQEAQDPNVPLYERIKFLAIYSSNLDEFFRVRVASLRSFKELKKKTRKALAIKPKKELREIRKMVQQQQQAFGRIFRGEIMPALQENGIYLIDEMAYNTEQRQFAAQYFQEQVYACLQPIYLHENQAIPFLENAQLYFVVQFQESERLAMMNIPSSQLPRFVTMPGSSSKHYITFLDNIIRFNLQNLFEQPIEDAYAIKLSRDAELIIEDEYDGNLLEKIKKGLKTRNVGLPTRFLYDSEMPETLLLRLKNIFQLSKNDLIPGARHHNFNDFFSFPNPSGNALLHDKPLPPLAHPDLENADSIFKVIQKKDTLLHFPYQKYDYIIQLLQEAATDPLVRHIYITLYRVSSKSAVAESLLQACKAGKKVTVFIEAKARFDEENNLLWGAKLEAMDAKVFYSQPGIKVHSKLLLISREENQALRHYAYIGTGNFNEKTARLYTDHALLTADERLTEEVLQVFDYLDHKKEPNCQHLLVSPFTLRQRFLDLVDQEIANARAGKIAYIRLKMNSLEDQIMIDKLYEASKTGVQIQLIVRGICCLVAGVEGQSENIDIISIVDRFLEHARIYWFANGGDEKLYLASADWMTRNLDRRVEVAVPIYNPALFNELTTILNLQWQDQVKARILNATCDNAYRVSNSLSAPIRAQIAIYEYLQQQMTTASTLKTSASEAL